MANIFFITMGLIFILLGIILLLILTLQAKSRSEVKSHSVGFILLGPFPIFFSSRRLLTVLLMVILFFMVLIVVTLMGGVKYV